MAKYDKNKYKIDFSNDPRMSEEDKQILSNIQENYNPIERADYLIDYRNEGKITDDEFETLTSLPPYKYDMN